MINFKNVSKPIVSAGRQMTRLADRTSPRKINRLGRWMGIAALTFAASACGGKVEYETVYQNPNLDAGIPAQDAGKAEHDVAPDIAILDTGKDTALDADIPDVIGDNKSDAPIDAPSDVQSNCPVGKYINVPSTDHPTLPEAIIASEPGDIINVAEGTYPTYQQTLKYCVKLIGSGKGQTIINNKTNPLPPIGSFVMGDYILKASDQSHISDVTIADELSTGDPSFAALQLEAGQAFVENSRINSLLVTKSSQPIISSSELSYTWVIDNAAPTFGKNEIKKIFYMDDSGGLLTGSVFPAFVGFAISRDGSHPTLRNNIFNSSGVYVFHHAYPDLGTKAIPGGNKFDNQCNLSQVNLCYSISSESSEAIEAQGNYFEKKSGPEVGATEFSTYDEMKACSTPTTPPCNVTAVNASTGAKVDFAGFMPITP
ncbi:MAG: hypothetical protein WC632_01280 [Candidatus Margulisiibacteriota bacterium]